MWNYYTKGNGYNLGIDIDKIIKLNQKENVSIQKVVINYNRNKLIQNTTDFILNHSKNKNKIIELSDLLNQNLEENAYNSLLYEKNGLIEDFTSGIFKLKLGSKHEAYEREEEVRLIISENDFQQKTTKFKVSENGVFFEYYSLDLDLKSNLKSVCIHPLNGQLHLQGTNRFIKSVLPGNKIEATISNIPFRIV